MFRNPLDEENPKLSLGVQFDQVFMEKTWETSCSKIWKIAKPAAPFATQLLESGHVLWTIME